MNRIKRLMHINSMSSTVDTPPSRQILEENGMWLKEG